MYNLFGWTKSIASNPYAKVNPFSMVSVEKQVAWALDWAEKKLNDAETSSCKGLARIDIGSAATSLCEADSTDNTPEHTERIRKLDMKLQDIALKWNIV